MNEAFWGGAVTYLVVPDDDLRGILQSSRKKHSSVNQTKYFLMLEIALNPAVETTCCVFCSD